MMDLGFDDAQMHPEMEEKYSHLAEQLESPQHVVRHRLQDPCCNTSGSRPGATAGGAGSTGEHSQTTKLVVVEQLCNPIRQ